VDISLFELVVALVATLIGAAVQASVGFGFAVVSIPILALVDEQLVPVPQLLLSFPLALLILARERAHIDFRDIRWIVVGRVIGGVAAAPLLSVLSGDSLELVIGGIVLFTVVTIAAGASIPFRRETQVGAGAVSGATGLITSMGGPALALLYANHAGAKLRSSLAAVFVIGLSINLVIRIFGSAIAVSDVWIGAALLPALIVGYVVGARLAWRVDRRGIRTYVLIVSATASAALIVRALAG